ncbi:MAG: hypothetical protein U0T83_06680 [Bacteriovoracaceae bacterium]
MYLLKITLLTLLISSSSFAHSLRCVRIFSEATSKLFVSVSNLGTPQATALVTVNNRLVFKVDKQSLNYRSVESDNYLELNAIGSARAFYVKLAKSLFDGTNKTKSITFKIADRTNYSLLKKLTGYPNFQLNCHLEETED